MKTVQSLFDFVQKIKTLRRAEAGGASGFGLIEVMIAVAIVTVLALGITTLLQDMYKQQQRGQQKATILTLQKRLIDAIQSTDGWEAIVANATNNSVVQCMRNPPTPATGCANETWDVATNTAPGQGAAYLLNIYDTSGAALLLSRTATQGFTSDGRNCNTFSSATPNPQCPFRWDIYIRKTCAGGGANCIAPSIQIIGMFRFRSVDAVGTNQNGQAFNTENYSFDFMRGALVTLNDQLRFWYETTGTGGEAGSCTNAWVTRQLNRTFNPNNLQGVGAAPVANQFRLPIGTYSCRITAPGFKNGGNRIRLLRNGALEPGAESGVSVASVAGGGSVVNTLDVNLRVNAVSDFTVQQFCTSRPSAATYGSRNDNWSLGAPVPTSGGAYSPVVYTVVNCIRTAG